MAYAGGPGKKGGGGDAGTAETYHETRQMPARACECVCVCVCVCVCLCLCVPWPLCLSPDGWICCSCSQQVLTPEAGPSMSSSPTTPILAQRAGFLPLLPPWVCTCVCMCVGETEREKKGGEREIHVLSCQLFCTYQTGAIQRGRLLAAHHHTMEWFQCLACFFIYLFF